MTDQPCPSCTALTARLQQAEQDLERMKEAYVTSADVRLDAEVRAEAAERQVLALREHAVHKSNCASFLCDVMGCGWTKDAIEHYVGTVDSHEFKARDCTCGRSSLLTGSGG